MRKAGRDERRAIVTIASTTQRKLDPRKRKASEHCPHTCQAFGKLALCAPGTCLETMVAEPDGDTYESARSIRICNFD